MAKWDRYAAATFPVPRSGILSTLILLLFSGWPAAVSAQIAGVGTGVRAYPAGIIVTLLADVSLAERLELRLTGGYNATDRGDWGEHDSETGGGFGAGAGLLVGPRNSRGWFFGIHAELWDLNIDWEDPGASGSTGVRVLMPTGSAGYRWPAGGVGSYWEVGLSLGMEFNVRTRGQPVGDGPILLIGAARTFGL